MASIASKHSKVSLGTTQRLAIADNNTASVQERPGDEAKERSDVETRPRAPVPPKWTSIVGTAGFRAPRSWQTGASPASRIDEVTEAVRVYNAASARQQASDERRALEGVYPWAYNSAASPVPSPRTTRSFSASPRATSSDGIGRRRCRGRKHLAANGCGVSGPWTDSVGASIFGSEPLLQARRIPPGNLDSSMEASDRAGVPSFGAVRMGLQVVGGGPPHSGTAVLPLLPPPSPASCKRAAPEPFHVTSDTAPFERSRSISDDLRTAEPWNGRAGKCTWRSLPYHPEQGRRRTLVSRTSSARGHRSWSEPPTARPGDDAGGEEPAEPRRNLIRMFRPPPSFMSDVPIAWEAEDAARASERKSRQPPGWVEGMAGVKVRAHSERPQGLRTQPWGAGGFSNADRVVVCRDLHGNRDAPCDGDYVAEFDGAAGSRTWRDLDPYCPRRPQRRCIAVEDRVGDVISAVSDRVDLNETHFRKKMQRKRPVKYDDAGGSFTAAAGRFSGRRQVDHPRQLQHPRTNEAVQRRRAPPDVDGRRPGPGASAQGDPTASAAGDPPIDPARPLARAARPRPVQRRDLAHTPSAQDQVASVVFGLERQMHAENFYTRQGWGRPTPSRYDFLKGAFAGAAGKASWQHRPERATLEIDSPWGSRATGGPQHGVVVGDMGCTPPRATAQPAGRRHYGLMCGNAPVQERHSVVFLGRAGLPS